MGMRRFWPFPSELLISGACGLVLAFIGGILWGPERFGPLCIVPMIISRLAAMYESAECTPSSEELAALRRWVNEQFWQLPCPVDFHYEDINLDQTITVYDNTGILPISVLHNDHPYLSFRDNARFRAVHDWHHILIGADSTMQGEIATFRHAKSTAPKSIHWLLFSEIVLQAAACLHNGGEFQPQRFIKAGGF